MEYYYYVVEDKEGRPIVTSCSPLEIKDALNKMTDTDLEDVTVIKGIEVEATRKVTLKEVE